MKNIHTQLRDAKAVRLLARFKTGASRLTTLGIMALSTAVVVCSSCWRSERGGKSAVELLERRSTSEQSGAAEGTISRRNRTGIQLPTAPGLVKASLGDVAVKVDPTRDPGWQSEVLGTAVSGQLKVLGNLLARHAVLNSDQLAEVAHPDIECGALRPDLSEVFRDGAFVVLRADTSEGPPASGGLTGLATALARLRAPFAQGAKLRIDFKTVHVNVSSENITTASYFQSSGDGPRGTVQQTAIWNCRWTLDSPPRLVAVAVEDFEEVVMRSPSQKFTDCTQGILGDNAAFREQLIHGTNHWLNNLDIAFGFPFGNQGLAIADVNGDGMDDVYVNQPAGLPNRLFIRQSKGTVIDASANSGLDWLDNSAAALFVDLDNDGDQDVTIALRNELVIHENNGKAVFTVRRRFRTPSYLKSLAAADYDRDGDLDLFACGYNQAAGASLEDVFANPIPYHDANNGGPNLLVRNDGQFSFTDVTALVGLDANNRRYSYAAAWEDYDNDGDVDLYVANDYGRNNLYRNQQGHFVDVASEAGVEDIGAGMSVSWGDYNRDGLMDLYVGNMFSSAGNRITHQAQFKDGTDEEIKNEYRRHARGNSLFENTGRGRFRDVSVHAGVTMGRWAWGSLLADINNDGWEDLCVANGFITTRDTGDL